MGFIQFPPNRRGHDDTQTLDEGLRGHHGQIKTFLQSPWEPLDAPVVFHLTKTGQIYQEDVAVLVFVSHLTSIKIESET